MCLVPLTAYGKNAALTGATGKMTWIGLFKSEAFPPTSGTAVAASLINMTGAKAKGFTNGKIVVFRTVTGSVTGLIAERPYYVVGEVTNGFEVALEEGGAAVKVAGHELEVSGTSVALLTEVSGGEYKRLKTTWAAAALGVEEDVTAHLVKVPASTTVTDAGWWETETVGKLIATQKLENPETFTGAGTYEFQSEKLEANALA